MELGADISWFLVLFGRAKRAPHIRVSSILWYIYIAICLEKVLPGTTYGGIMHGQGFGACVDLYRLKMDQQKESKYNPRH